MAGLTLLSGLLFFCDLKSNDFSEREAREALAVFEMVGKGDLFLPKINGETLRTKPPLFHWIAYCFAYIEGAVDELAVRLPSAISATAGILSTFLFGIIFIGPRAGMLSAIILATNVEYLEIAHRARVDMTFAIFVILAHFLFYTGYKTGKKICFSLFFVAIGLAVLTKGPIGFIFPIASVLSFLIIREKTDFIWEINFMKGTLVVLIILSLWLIPALLIGKGELLDIIYQETIARFLGTTTHQSHIEPFYYYFPRLLGGFAPWSLFLPVVLTLNLRESKKDEVLLFLLSWFICIFLFLSVCAGKRGDYLLPLYPAASLLVGKSWSDFIGSGKNFNFKLYFSLSSFPVLIAGILFLIIGMILFFNGTFLNFSFVPIVSSILVREDSIAFEYFWKHFESWFPYLSAFLFLQGFLGIGHFIAIRKKKGLGSFSLLFLMCFSLAVAVAFILPEVNRRISLKPFVEDIRKNVPENAKLSFYGKINLKIIFYSGRHIPSISQKSIAKYFDGETPAYLIIRENVLGEVEKRSRSPVFIVASYRNFRQGLLLLSNKF